MTSIKEQIFQELDALEKATLGLRSDVNTAGRQTDLEVAILKQQICSLRIKNERATELIDKSIDILNKLKRPQ